MTSEFIFENNEENKTKHENSQKYYSQTDFSVFLRSCEEEITEPISGKITGNIPKWLNGTLIRNGPGNLKFGKFEFKHLFDGSALLHKYRIENGNVTYQCRFLKTEVYKQNWEAKRIVISEFGTESVPDPCHSLLKRLSTWFNPFDLLTDNGNISVYPMGDEIYSFSETVYAHKINSETLETIERKNITDHIPLVIHHSSHPHVTQNGSVYNLALSMGIFGAVHHIVCFKKPADGEKSIFDTAHIVATVPSKWPFHPSYMHTFGITDNYFILIQQPFSVSIAGSLKMVLKNKPTSSALRWYGDEQTTITVINRHTNQTENYYTKAFFFLHIINQYEIDDKYLIIDVCCYKNPNFVNCMFTEELMNAQSNPCFAEMARNRPQRFVLPLVMFSKNNLREKLNPAKNLVNLEKSLAKAFLQNGNILLFPEILCNISCETPQIYYKKYSGKPYRYFYAIGADVDSENPGVIIKTDTFLHTYKTWSEKNCYPSEPIFFPKPNNKQEDDGIIMTSLLWGEGQSNKIGLLILDATTLEELGRVEFKTPSPAPKCLHGWYFPN